MKLQFNQRIDETVVKKFERFIRHEQKPPIMSKGELLEVFILEGIERRKLRKESVHYGA